MSKIFFTSDLHFSHKNIAKFCPQFRPFDNIADMDEYLIETWNDAVSPADDVYNLGDLSFARDIKKIAAILSRLNGKHHLIYGNHDDIVRRHNKYLFETVKHDGHPLLSSARTYRKLQLEEIDNTLILFHYPINEWDGCHKGTPQDIDGFLSPLPKISYFGENTSVPSQIETAKDFVSHRLQAINNL